MMAKSAEESARYIMTIFQRHNTRKGGTILMNNLTLPFVQDGWTLEDLEAGLPYAVEQGWLTIGKESKFVTLTEAGVVVAPVANQPVGREHLTS
jgi:hypothetical protein